MIRTDFVSNSSSSSFVVSLTNEEVKNIDRPKTILEFILRSKKLDFCELHDPVDLRKDDSRFYLWNGKRRKFDVNKYEDYICPWKYNTQSDFIATKDSIYKYLECCKNCTDKKDCYNYPRIKKCCKEIDKGKTVYCFELRSTDPIYIEDTDFADIKDPHVVDAESSH